MKQKYIIQKNKESNELLIKEYNELEKDILSVVFESVYKEDIVKSAVTKGKKTLIETLRTKQFYPPAENISKIADSVLKLYESDTDNHVELFFDDMDFFVKEESESPDDISSSINELEKLLDEETLKDTNGIMDNDKK